MWKSNISHFADEPRSLTCSSGDHILAPKLILSMERMSKIPISLTVSTVGPSLSIMRSCVLNNILSEDVTENNAPSSPELSSESKYVTADFPEVSTLKAFDYPVTEIATFTLKSPDGVTMLEAFLNGFLANPLLKPGQASFGKLPKGEYLWVCGWDSASVSRLILLFCR